ncbi:protein MARD1-like [Durio zibethinus]|uniref:Protein MARD1-like n=1 Tax=Durio zibethinus TaxID=66656 RepID=A0A6P6A0K3_DURZI|nr:protein MARD1-like [Durio zibethinus]
MKRSRVNGSTSFGNIRILKPPSAAASAFRWNSRINPSIISAHAPPQNVWERAREGLLTLPAPQVTVESGQRSGQVSHFLDNCFFCKKGLRQNDETFMYGDFRAFCTPECRTKQIAVDNEMD